MKSRGLLNARLISGHGISQQMMLERMGWRDSVSGLLPVQRCICLLGQCHPAGLGNNRAFCLADVQAAFAFFSWGQLKHRESTDLTCKRVSGAFAGRVTSNLAKVTQQVLSEIDVNLCVTALAWWSQHNTSISAWHASDLSKQYVAR